MIYVFRWYEADAPWGDLDEDGMTEPEAAYDNDDDDEDGEGEGDD